MGVDAFDTGSKLGLAAAVVEAFTAFWERSFFTPAHLAHDVPISPMVDLVHRAQAAGATVKFLSGRCENFHSESLKQLHRAGVDAAAADVVCKLDVSVNTQAFKEQHIKAWSSSSELGFFVTEGTRDLRHLQACLPDVPLLRLGCSFEDPAGLARVPLWPAVF